MSWNGACARADLRCATLLLAAVALALGACQRTAGKQERIIPVFGTIVQVEVAGGDAARNEAALDRLEALYRVLNVDWRSFGPGELGRVNALLRQGKPATLSPPLLALVSRGLELRERSGGLFEPRIGELVALWGFQDFIHGGLTAAPDRAAIDRARAALTSATLHLQGNRLWSDGPVSLELAGIAKGAALTAGARLLHAAGTGNALIVAGGDIIALGRHGDRPWVVGVRDPLGPGVLGRIALEPGEAITSSGTYERNFQSGGRRYHHLIDPRTGFPATGTAGTTVVAQDAELANAAAAALLIGGAARFDELTHALGITTALLVTEDGRRLTTPVMARRLAAP